MNKILCKTMDLSKSNVTHCCGDSLCSCSVQADPLPTPCRVIEIEPAMQAAQGS